MEFPPNTRAADTQILNSPINLTSSSGPPSATSTRGTSPASSTHRVLSTSSSSSPKKVPTASLGRKFSNMRSPIEQCVADKEALRDDEGRMMDKHALVQGPNGSVRLSQTKINITPNDNVGNTTSHLQNLATHNTIAVQVSDGAGKHSRMAIDHQNAEAAQTSGNTLNLGRRPNTMAEGRFGKLEEPYSIMGHQNGLDSGGFDSSDGDLNAFGGQGAGQLCSTHERTLASRRLENGHQQRYSTGREHCLGIQGSQGIPRPHNLHNTPSDTYNESGGRRGGPSDWGRQKPGHTYTIEEGHSALGAARSTNSARELVSTAQGLCYTSANVYNDIDERHTPQQDHLAAHNLHNSHGTPLGPQYVHNRFANKLPVQDSYHGPAVVYDAGAQGQNTLHGHKDIPTALYHRNTCSKNGDVGGQDDPLPQSSRLAQVFGDNQNKMLEAQDPYNTPANGHDARECGSVAARKLHEAHRTVSSLPGLRCIAPPNIPDELAQLPVREGSSDRATRCLPVLHNSSSTSAASVSTNQATGHHYNHQHQHHHSNNASPRSAPRFSLPIPTVFGSNALSVGTIPFVPITNPFATDSLRSNANNIATSSQQSEPHVGHSPSKDPSHSSLSTASPSSSTTYTATMFPPRGIVISDGDMERATGYCFDRGDGQYTRLVPVDVLPFSLRDLPARVSSHEGMIVLPVPRMVGPDGQPGHTQLVSHMASNNVTPPVSPTGTAQGGSSTDLIQNRIDNIIAAAPNATSGPIILARATTAVNGTGRREKIYCDKWIHDGTCAFTQQGCKFKHEMPMDKETQQSLGLFHGLPAWYRKQEAERVMHLDDRPIPLGGGAVGYYGVGPAGSRFGNNGGAFGAGAGAASRTQNWRRIEAATPASGATADEGSSPLSGGSSSRGTFGRGRNTTRIANYRTTTNFGPIGPPSQNTLALSGGLGGNRHRTNTTASCDMLSTGGAPVFEAQRDDAAPRGGVHIGVNPFEALEDYASTPKAESDRGKDFDEALG